MIKAIAFDAYGTIFDVLSVNRLADEMHPGRGNELAALWRTKQIDYTRLRTMSGRYVPFSQVTRDGLRHALRALGLDATDADFERLMGEYDLLSVDAVGRFKTAPEAYALGPAAFGLEPDEILFVSSNCWDACGATWYGYTTFWINRSGAPLEELGVVPTATGSTMRDVMAFVTPRLR